MHTVPLPCDRLSDSRPDRCFSASASKHSSPPLIFGGTYVPPAEESLIVRALRPFWHRAVPHGIRQRVFDLRSKLSSQRRASAVMQVPISRLLMGDQVGLTGTRFAQLTRQPLYPSTQVVRSPYIDFLLAYEQHGNDLLRPEILGNTSYFRHVSDCIRVAGHYGEATCQDEIHLAAQHFIDHLNIHTPRSSLGTNSISGSDRPIEVRAIAHSDCFQIIDGHHRVAIAHFLGHEQVPVIVVDKPVFTPLQSMLLDGMWLNGRRELYQPVNSPELSKEWVLVRKCNDRLAKFKAFLADTKLLPHANRSYLDVGAAYGWFVKEMRSLGFEAHGVDQDMSATLVGSVMYGLPASCVTTEDLVHFLRTTDQSYDVVSCMSVLHHYARGFAKTSAEDVVRLLDKVTRHVLFFETGQSHEAWLQSILPEWDDEFIERWLRTNTTFKTVRRLGPDEDAVPPFNQNYSRTLFVCTR